SAGTAYPVCGLRQLAAPVDGWPGNRASAELLAWRAGRCAGAGTAYLPPASGDHDFQRLLRAGETGSRPDAKAECIEPQPGFHSVHDVARCVLCIAVSLYRPD